MVGGAQAKTYGTILCDQRLKEPKIIFVWGAKFNSPKSYGVNFCDGRGLAQTYRTILDDQRPNELKPMGGSEMPEGPKVAQPKPMVAFFGRNFSNPMFL
jgi:hypothetical protein